MIDPGVIAVFIPIIALLIPIVAILISHQQKMAQIIHGGGGPEARQEIEALRREVAELRQAVQNQTIAVDNLLSVRKTLTHAEDAPARLSPE